MNKLKTDAIFGTKTRKYTDPTTGEQEVWLSKNSQEAESNGTWLRIVITRNETVAHIGHILVVPVRVSECVEAVQRGIGTALQNLLADKDPELFMPDEEGFLTLHKATSSVDAKDRLLAWSSQNLTEEELRSHENVESVERVGKAWLLETKGGKLIQAPKKHAAVYVGNDSIVPHGVNIPLTGKASVQYKPVHADDKLGEYRKGIEDKFVWIPLDSIGPNLNIGADAASILDRPSVRKNVELLSQAQRRGVTQTHLLIPKEGPVTSISGLMPWTHDGASDGKYFEEALQIHADLFYVQQLLITDPAAYSHYEGPLYDQPMESMFSDQAKTSANVLVPGTTIKVYSAEGQKFLFEHRDALMQLLRLKNTEPGTSESSFVEVVWHRNSNNVTGSTSLQTYKRGQLLYPQYMQTRRTSFEPFKLILPLVGSQAKISGISLDDLAVHLQLFLKAQKQWAALHRIREEEAFICMQGKIPSARVKIPAVHHLFYGTNHSHEFLSLAEKSGMMVLLTKSVHLKKLMGTYIYDDDRNPEVRMAQAALERL